MEWISVKDRLPDCERVLAIYLVKKDSIYIMGDCDWFINTIYSCRFRKGEFFIESRGPTFSATHWMTLPKPPNGE